MRKLLLKKFLILFVFLGLGVLSLLLDSAFPEQNLSKLPTTFFAIAVAYFVLRFLLEILLRNSIDYSRTRYSLRKVLRMGYFGALFLIIVTIWVEDTESLLVTYGLFSAGVALAIQDTFKNFLGGLNIYLSGLYGVGDRIELDGVIGDVVDISFIYTTVLELIEAEPNIKVASQTYHVYNMEVGDAA